MVRVFWCFIGAFAFGVFLRSFWVLESWTCAFLALLSVSLVGIALLSPKHSRALVVSAIAIVAIAVGIGRMSMGIIRPHPVLDVLVGTNIIVEGVIVDAPDTREKSVRVPVKLEKFESGERIDAKILAIVPLHTDVIYGDRVRVEGTLQLPQVFETGEGRVFDYPSYLAKDGIRYEVAFAQVEMLSRGEGFFLKSWALASKQWYLDGLTASLSEPQAGLAGGITVGDKRGLGEELSDIFQTVSLTHIVVLSGYNIMIVIFALRWLLDYFHVGPRWQFGIGVAVAVFFVLITGFASASVRAASMAVIALFGTLTKRTYLASRALGVVVLGMLLWNPYVLAFDPGFQLSILATAGLITLSPLVTKYLYRIPEVIGLREITASSISAQIAVVPLLLYQNGELSIYALPVNLLALIAVPFAMLFSAIAGVLGAFLGPIATIAGFPAYVLLSYIIFVADFFAALPFARITLPAFSFVSLIAVYAALVASAYLVTQKKGTGVTAEP